jgi:hypothetical protein
MAKANPGFSALVARFPGRTARLGRSNTRPGHGLAALRLCAFSAAVAGLLTFGCGTYATLQLAAPSTALTGAPFTITVSATIGTSPDRVINSPVRFTSSDRAAILPPVYYFNANDAGSHTFINGVTLRTAGNQSITATVFGASGLTATANVTVSDHGSAIQCALSRNDRTCSPMVRTADANGRGVIPYPGRTMAGESHPQP